MLASNPNPNPDVIFPQNPVVNCITPKPIGTPGHSFLKPVVEVQGLKVYRAGKCVLDLPYLILNPAQRVALVGSNGAGKSTLLKVMGGFIPIDEGSVCILGRHFGASAPRPLSAKEWRALHAEIGQVMQALHLVPRLSALHNAVLGALARQDEFPLWRSWVRYYPKALLNEAQRALEDLGLGHCLHTRAEKLSGGEQQKTSLARLRLQNPKLILADEPTSALDPAATQQACAFLNAMAQQATLISVVHDTQLLPTLADRVLGLKAGQLIFDLPVGDVSPQVLTTLYQSGALS